MLKPIYIKSDFPSLFAQQQDIHQSSCYRTVMESIGWKTYGEPGSYIYIHTLGPFAVAKMQRPSSIDTDILQHTRKKFHCFITYIEPSLSVQLNKEKVNFLDMNPLEWDRIFKTTLHASYGTSFAHTKTSLIDLRKTPEELLQSFKQKTRYNIRLSEKRERIKVVSTLFENLTSQQKDQLFQLQSSWSKRKGVIGYPVPFMKAVIQGWQNHGTVYCAYIDQTLEAALYVLNWKNVAIYYAAFATPKAYAEYATTLLTWKALCGAQSKGSTIFDFCGIYDPRYPSMYKRWTGFTTFKEGFNPTPIEYPRTWKQLFW